jgi:anti-sigma factor RsiW
MSPSQECHLSLTAAEVDELRRLLAQVRAEPAPAPAPPEPEPEPTPRRSWLRVLLGLPAPPPPRHGRRIGH